MKETIFEQVASAASVLKLDLSAEEFALFAEDRGGEQFLASLSLAFGLSDVVQNHSGAVRLDSLFIDEGFGSLDGETLDTAMKALAMLQSGGRLIGIISHVSELKNRIPCRRGGVPPVHVPGLPQCGRLAAGPSRVVGGLLRLRLQRRFGRGRVAV